MYSTNIFTYRKMLGESVQVSEKRFECNSDRETPQDFKALSDILQLLEWII